jgi:hypothetical protein
MSKPRFGPKFYKGEKNFGTRRATYRCGKTLSAASCLIYGINNSMEDCRKATHGGQSCQEVRQIVMDAVRNSDLGTERRLGYGYSLPWGISQVAGGWTFLYDCNGLYIVQLHDNCIPTIVPPTEMVFHMRRWPLFPLCISPDDEYAFAASLTLAVGYGLWEEVVWRNHLSDIGTKPLSEWSTNWRTWGRGTYYDYHQLQRT